MSNCERLNDEMNVCKWNVLSEKKTQCFQKKETTYTDSEYICACIMCVCVCCNDSMQCACVSVPVSVPVHISLANCKS